MSTVIPENAPVYYTTMPVYRRINGGRFLYYVAAKCQVLQQLEECEINGTINQYYLVHFPLVIRYAYDDNHMRIESNDGQAFLPLCETHRLFKTFSEAHVVADGYNDILTQSRRDSDQAFREQLYQLELQLDEISPLNVSD